MAFNLNETFQRLKNSDQGPYSKIINLPKEAVNIAMEQKQRKGKTPQKELQLNPQIMRALRHKSKSTTDASLKSRTDIFYEWGGLSTVLIIIY